jgi:hypothetical protein
MVNAQVEYVGTPNTGFFQGPVDSFSAGGGGYQGAAGSMNGASATANRWSNTVSASAQVQQTISSYSNYSGSWSSFGSAEMWDTLTFKGAAPDQMGLVTMNITVTAQASFSYPDLLNLFNDWGTESGGNPPPGYADAIGSLYYETQPYFPNSPPPGASGNTFGRTWQLSPDGSSSTHMRFSLNFPLDEGAVTFTAYVKGDVGLNGIYWFYPYNPGNPLNCEASINVDPTLTFTLPPGVTFTSVSGATYSNVPGPATVLLLGPGLVGLAAVKRRFKKWALFTEH